MGLFLCYCRPGELLLTQWLNCAILWNEQANGEGPPKQAGMRCKGKGSKYINELLTVSFNGFVSNRWWVENGY